MVRAPLYAPFKQTQLLAETTQGVRAIYYLCDCIFFRAGGGSRLATPPTTRHHHHRPVIVNIFNPPLGGAQPSLHLRYNSAKALTHTHTFLPSERWILQLLVSPPLLSGVRRADPLHDAHHWYKRQYMTNAQRESWIPWHKRHRNEGKER